MKDQLQTCEFGQITYDGDWQAYNTLARVKWEADDGIYAQFRDATGNESEVYELIIWPGNGPYDMPEGDQSEILFPIVMGE